MDVSDIFYFFLLGGGEEEVRGDREGGWLFIENPRRGGRSPRRGGGRGEGAVRVSAGNLGGGVV